MHGLLTSPWAAPRQSSHPYVLHYACCSQSLSLITVLFLNLGGGQMLFSKSPWNDCPHTSQSAWRVFIYPTCCGQVLGVLDYNTWTVSTGPHLLMVSLLLRDLTQWLEDFYACMMFIWSTTVFTRKISVGEAGVDYKCCHGSIQVGCIGLKVFLFFSSFSHFSSVLRLTLNLGKISYMTITVIVWNNGHRYWKSDLNMTNRLKIFQTRKLSLLPTTALAFPGTDGKCRFLGPFPCHWDKNLWIFWCSRSIMRSLEQYYPIEHSVEVEIRNIETTSLMGLSSPIWPNNESAMETT